MTDADPIVLDPDDPSFAHPAQEAGGFNGVLSRIMGRSREALLSARGMQDYLAAAGVPDQRVWSSFRIGAGSDLLTADLSDANWTELAALGLVSPPSRKLGMAWSTGLNLPTFDPRQPDEVVRLTPAQHQHRFMTKPLGVACSADITNAPRIILADVPLLGLRLANFGVPGVAIGFVRLPIQPLSENDE